MVGRFNSEKAVQRKAIKKINDEIGTENTAVLLDLILDYIRKGMSYNDIGCALFQKHAEIGKEKRYVIQHRQIFETHDDAVDFISDTFEIDHWLNLLIKKA
jgi:hypothetical protein